MNEQFLREVVGFFVWKKQFCIYFFIKIIEVFEFKQIINTNKNHIFEYKYVVNIKAFFFPLICTLDSITILTFFTFLQEKKLN